MPKEINKTKKKKAYKVRHKFWYGFLRKPATWFLKSCCFVNKTYQKVF
jgi:hypothetical protein